MEHPPCSPDLAPNNFWTFPKIKSALKGRRFQDTEDIKKMKMKGILQQWFQKCFVGLSAELLKGSTSKVTPLTKL
jgi:hypothetical protein